MRPCQYHYLKRMWTRNVYKPSPSKKKGGCCSFIVMFFVALAILSAYISIIKAIAILIIAIVIICSVITIATKIIPWLHAHIITPSFSWLLNKFHMSTEEIDENESNTLSCMKITEVNKDAQQTTSISKLPNATTSIEENINMKVQDLQPHSAKMSIISGNNLNEEMACVDDSCFIDETQYTFRWKKVQNPVSPISLSTEQYAIMCNAYMHHQDEMAQYDFARSSESDDTSNLEVSHRT